MDGKLYFFMFNIIIIIFNASDLLCFWRFLYFNMISKFSSLASFPSSRILDIHLQSAINLLCNLLHELSWIQFLSVIVLVLHVLIICYCLHPEWKFILWSKFTK